MPDWEYRSGLGFGRRSALLISDMQNAFTRGHYDPEFVQDAEIERINVLIALFRERSLPIAATAIVFDEYDAAHPNIWMQKIPKLSDLRDGSDLVRIDDSLLWDPAFDKLIVKKQPSSFHGTPLAEQWQAEGVDTIVTTGCVTSGCVRASVIDGMQHGFRMMVVKDAVADRWPDAHEQALFEIDSKYGDVIALETCKTGISGR